MGQAAREAAGREAALAADVERLQQARRAAASAAEPSAAAENGAAFVSLSPSVAWMLVLVAHVASRHEAGQVLQTYHNQCQQSRALTLRACNQTRLRA